MNYYYAAKGGHRMASWLMPKFPRKVYAPGSNQQGHDSAPIEQPRMALARFVQRRPVGYDPYRGARSYDK